MSDPINPKDTGTEPTTPAAPERSLGRLGAELMDLARTDPAAFGARIAGLGVREQAELALRLPAAQRLQLLLHAPKPMRLVRALPPSELYLTVREVGPNDALPLLALASGRQTRHLLDLESWRKDRFDADRAGAWAALLTETGEPTMRRFIRNLDDEVLALLLSKWARVEQLEYEDGAQKDGHGQGDAGTAEGGLTPDGYHRFSPTIPEHAPAVSKLLQMLFVEFPDRYQRVLWNARWELPSELEEQALHWCESRLVDHGFPDMADAVNVYAPPLKPVRRPPAPVPADVDSLAASRAPLRLASQQKGLIPAIDRLDDSMRERVLQELVAVANRLLRADGADAGDPASHQAALEKAAAYVEMAVRERESRDRESVTAILERTPALELFRQGWSRAQALQERARTFASRPAQGNAVDPLDVLDSPIRERVGALLERRPRYYELTDEGGFTREFLSRAEIDEAEVSLEVAELFDPIVLDLFGPEAVEQARRAVPQGAFGPLLSTFLLTAMAWNATRDRLSVAPLPEDVAADFLRSVASRRTAGPDAPGRAFEALVARLVDAARLDARQTAVLKAFGRYAVERLVSECANLDPGSSHDPRSIGCLLLKNRDDC